MIKRVKLEIKEESLLEMYIDLMKEVEKYRCVHGDYPRWLDTYDNSADLRQRLDAVNFRIIRYDMPQDEVICLNNATYSFTHTPLTWEGWYQLFNQYLEETKLEYISPFVKYKGYYVGKWIKRQYLYFDLLSKQQQDAINELPLYQKREAVFRR